jgi:hypothetical protein
VLLGSFQSYDATAANTHYARLREHFAALGRLINQYPAIRVSSGERCTADVQHLHNAETESGSESQGRRSQVVGRAVDALLASLDHS